LDKSEWIQEVEIANEIRKASPLRMADLLWMGMQVFCTSKQEEYQLIDEVAEQLEISTKTIKNYIAIATKFPPTQRKEYPRLEMGHYDAVSGLDEEEAVVLLASAQLEGWSVVRLRYEVDVAKGKTSTDTDAVTERRQAVLSKLGYVGIDAEATSKSLKLWLGTDLIEISSSTDLDWRIG
jgi:predicted transcriptional regulator